MRMVSKGLLWGLVVGLVAALPAVGQQPIQTFFVPNPETQVRTWAGSMTVLPENDEIHSVVSITITADGTIIYYDHWENGFDTVIENPDDLYSNPGNLDGTQIWGDGDPSNGAPPAGSCCADDLLDQGDVLILESDVPVPGGVRDPLQIFFDGGDKFAATDLLAVTRGAWPSTGVEAQLGGAVEVFSTDDWGSAYELPLGEDVVSAFDFTGVSIMAQEDGTLVNVDSDADGTDDLSQVLNQGESFLVSAVGVTDLLLGATINSSSDVQVNLLTSREGTTYEGRWYSLLPIAEWTDLYFNPVGRTVAGTDVEVFLYNPNGSAITVSVEELGSCTDVVVPAGGFTEVVLTNALPQISASRFSTSGTLTNPGLNCAAGAPTGGNFFAVGTMERSVQIFDWGHTLIPESSLTPSAVVGWAPGSTDLVQNASPVWVTAVEPGAGTLIYVDYDGDPSTGPNTDPVGNMYDVSIAAVSLEAYRISDPDNDQTGMRLYTLDGTRLTAAWGQDPEVAGPGEPTQLDMGTTVLPFSSLAAFKDSAIVDSNGNGGLDPGEAVFYTIRVRNTGIIPITDVDLLDTLDPNTSYVPATTEVDGLAIPDDAVGTPFPLDGDPVATGYPLVVSPDSLDPGDEIVVTFLATVNSPLPGGTTEIVNNVQVSSDSEVFVDSESDPIPQGDISIVKTSNAPALGVAAGSTVTYTILVSNTSGGRTLTEIMVDDVLPPGTSYVAQSTVVTGPTGIAGTYQDTFSAALYNGNTGSIDWSDELWLETGDDGLPGSGNIDIVGGELHMQGPETNASIERQLDLSGADTATFEFDWRCAGDMETSDDIFIEVSGNGGGAWTLLDTLEGETDICQEPGDADSGSESYDITAFIATNTRIRFRYNISVASEDFFVDVVTVTATHSPETKDNVPGGANADLDDGVPPNLVNVVDDFVLTPGESFTITFDVLVDTPVDPSITRLLNVAEVRTAELPDPSQSSVSDPIIRGSIGDLVWLDLDGDGIEDIGEPGLANVEVSLFDAGPDGMPGGGDDVLIATQLTGLDGQYRFDNVPPGDFFVDVTDATLPAGLTISPGNSDPSAVVTVTGAEQFDDADFGYSNADPGTAILGDYIWNDIDRDGVQDPGELGIGGVTVELIDIATGLPFGAPVTTGPDGRYLFVGAPPGEYEVRVTDTGGVLGGMTPTMGPQSEGSFTSLPVTVAAGDVVDDLDFGFAPSACLPRLDFEVDAFGNPIAVGQTLDTEWSPWGLGLSFTVNAPSTGPLMAFASSSPTGGDADLGTPNETCTPPGLGQGAEGEAGQPGENCVPRGNLLIISEDGDAGDPDDAADGGSVTFDFTDDIEIEAVEFIDAENNLDSVELFDGAMASIFFSNLTAPGDNSYERLVVNTAGARQMVVTFPASGSIAAVDFCLGSIRDKLWFDLDNNGLFDLLGADGAPGTGDEEPGVAGVSLNLLDDTGAVIATTFTDANGNFGFDGLPDGDYTVVVTDTASVLQGFSGTTAPALADQLAVTITGGADVVGVNFGYNRPATIGDRVWSDTDGDGVQDPGEAGIAGVTVELWRDTDGDAVFDSTLDTLVATTVTGPGGSYLFPGLNPSIYYVSVDDSQPILTGYTPTTTDTQTGGNAAGTQIGTLLILGGQTYLNADFGYQNNALADISGTVFEDQDRDGVEDGGEPGFQNVTVDLLDDAGNVIATTVTDASGNYSFADLPAGDYSVQVTDVNGVLVGYSLTSGLDTINVTLGVSDVTDIDFGYARDPGAGSIGDTVWLDANGDGIRGGAEAGLSGVEVTLYLDDGDGIFNAGSDTVVATTLTDANGEYRFAGLGAGNYFVDVTEATVPQVGSLVETTAEPSALIPLSDSEQYDDADFGYAPAPGTATVGDRVWSDADGDGLQDPGEVGIAGVTIQVFGGVCTPCTTVSGADGSWLIAGLAPGDYTVTFAAPPPGFNPLPTNLDPQDSYNVTLVDGDLFTHLDFGFDGPALGTVGTFLWFDDNGDGDFDAGELGVEDVTINLVQDVNGNGVIDAGEPVIATVRTDSSGGYTFTGLSLSDSGDGDAGDADYLVDVTDIDGHLAATNLSVGIPDTDNNSQADPYDVALTAASPTNTVADFGYAPSLGIGAIGSQVWHDLDLDGFFEPLGDDGVPGGGDDEPGIQGVSLQLWLDDGDGVFEPFSGDDNLLRSISTDANGEYEFDALPPNTYWVTVTDVLGVVSGYARTPGGAPFACPGGDDSSKVDPCRVDLTTGSPTDLTVDFGYAADPTGFVMTISGTVFEDEDRDANHDEPGEPVVGGADVFLYSDLDGDGVLDVGEPLIGSTVSDAGGDYAFTNLPPGDYLVVVDPAGTSVDSFVQTTQAGTGGVEPVTLVDTDIADRDFGYWNGGIVTTPVTLASFSATGGSGRVTFTWTTATEVGNVGFHLWAIDDKGMQRVNAELVRASLGDAFEPRSYTFEAYGVSGETFLLEDRDLFGKSRYHGPFYLGETRGRPELTRRAIDWPRIRTSSREQAQARTLRRQARGLLSVQGPPVTLRVDREGIHRVSYEALDAAGANYAGVHVDDLWLESGGEPTPIRIGGAPNGIFGPGAYFEFVGRGVDSLYTRENVYSLRQQSGGARIMDALGRIRPGGAVPAYYLETARVENELRYHFAAPGDDPWFEAALLATAGPVEASFAFDLEGWLEGAAPVEMRVDLWGVTNFPTAPDHHVLIDVNEQPVADEWFDGLVDHPVTFEISDSALEATGNALRIQLPHDTGAEYDLVHYDGLSVSYPRRFEARDGALSFDYGRSRGFRVDGFASGEIVAYQETAEGVFYASRLSVDGVPGDFSANFSMRQRLPGRYHVASVDAVRVPAIELTPSPVDITSGTADLVIVSHADFVEGIEPLAQARRNRGLSVRVVELSHVYAQFSFGVADPQAIKSYLAHAYHEMETRFALLVGGDTYDYLDHLGTGSMSFVPTLYARTDEIVHYAPVDPLFVDFDSDGRVEMAIGRLPVRTVGELAKVVEKTLDYETIGYAGTALLAADGADLSTAYSFSEASEEMRAQLPADWSVDLAYIDDLGVEGARQSIIDGIEGGVALTSYFGHSGPSVWSFSDLFDTADAEALDNVGLPTVVAQWGCWNTYHVTPGFDTLSHALMLGDDRGAAAVLGAATLTEAIAEKRLGTELYQRLGRPGVTLGEAILEAKRALGEREPDLLDVLWGWTLLGDPTLIVQP